MFNDARSKAVVFVAHCILNQNAISDGTADHPGAVKDLVDVMSAANVGIIQMPCPELMCLGLDRGNIHGAASPVVVENTRIRGMMEREPAATKLKRLVEQVCLQISEYRKYGFHIRGIVGINRSPSCGVETTSKDNREVDGEGVFIAALRGSIKTMGASVRIRGVKAFEPEQAVKTIQGLLKINPP